MNIQITENTVEIDGVIYDKRVAATIEEIGEALDQYESLLEKEEYIYPLFKKRKGYGYVVMFTDLNTHIVMMSKELAEIGVEWNDERSHTDTDIWEDVHYDSERGLYEGQPVMYWDNNRKWRALEFFDEGCAPSWDNIEPMPLEEIKQWMIDVYYKEI